MDILAGCHVTQAIPGERCFSVSVSSANQWGQASIWQLYNASGLVKKKKKNSVLLQQEERLLEILHRTTKQVITLCDCVVSMFAGQRGKDVVVNQVPLTQALTTTEPVWFGPHSHRDKKKKKSIYLLFFSINTVLYQEMCCSSQNHWKYSST